MASLLERVGTLISANVNWLVSAALKANSMAIVDEYIRKVEDNLEALEDAAATVAGFRQYCAENDWQPALYQTLPDHLAHYQ